MPEGGGEFFRLQFSFRRFTAGCTGCMYIDIDIDIKKRGGKNN